MLDRDPLIETARLHLSLLSPADSPRVAAYFQRNQAHHGPWDPPRPERFHTEPYWREQLGRALADAADERSIRLWLVHRDALAGAVLGMINFSRLVRGAFQCAGLGYSLDHEAVGHGYMEEALRGALGWLFGTLGFHRVEANYRPENTRSARVLNRLGFEIEGYAREYLLVDGAWRDHVLTALRAPR